MKQGDLFLAEIQFENALETREKAERDYINLMALKELYSMPGLEMTFEYSWRARN